MCNDNEGHSVENSGHLGGHFRYIKQYTKCVEKVGSTAYISLLF